MISSSNILDRRHHLQNDGSAKPHRGGAIALAEGPISQYSERDTDPGGQDSLQDGRQVHADMPYYVIGELIKGKCAYQPPQPIDWGSTDYEIVRLACAWSLALSRFPPGLLSKNRPPVGYQRLVRYRPPPDTLGDHQGVADGQAAALRVLRPLVPS